MVRCTISAFADSWVRRIPGGHDVKTQLAPARRSAQSQPRRQPRQARSRATVDLILEATTQILEQDGMEAINTNYIAFRAGISIGSLYQYFPGKQALLQELNRRYRQTLSSSYDRVLAKVGSQSLELSLAEAFQSLIGCLVAHQRLHIVLELETDLAPELAFPEAVEAEGGIRKIRMILEAYRSEIVVKDLDLASFILGRTIRQVISGWIRSRSEQPSDDTICEELLEFSLAYLTGRPSGRR